MHSFGNPDPSHGGHHVAVKSMKHALEDGRPLTIESNSVSHKERKVTNKHLVDSLASLAQVRLTAHALNVFQIGSRHCSRYVYDY